MNLTELADALIDTRAQIEKIADVDVGNGKRQQPMEKLDLNLRRGRLEQAIANEVVRVRRAQKESK